MPTIQCHGPTSGNLLCKNASGIIKLFNKKRSATVSDVEKSPTETLKENEVQPQEIHEDELQHMGKGDETEEQK